MVGKIDLSKWVTKDGYGWICPLVDIGPLATRDGNGMELSPQVDNVPQGMEKEFPITERK